MTQEERSSLRFAWIEPDQYRDLVLYSNNLEPLKEGEIVRVDPTWYRTQNVNSTVLAKVGKVFQVTNPQKALGEGSTYEEMSKNAHMIRMSWAEIAACESDLRSTTVTVVTGGPSNWLPGLDTMD
jgi:hypothetical protein